MNVSFLFDRFLTVAEQMTTYHESADMTEILNNKSYWASYNNIYFPDFRNISGEEAMVKEKGPALYSWQNSSRAKIFRRDHNKILDLPRLAVKRPKGKRPKGKMSKKKWRKFL